jgi:hypothetical protein
MSTFQRLTLQLGVGDGSTHAKCDLLHNNLAECFNSWITKFRDKTILAILEGIRTSLMRGYQRKREIIAAMEGNVGPKIKEKLEIEEDEAGHCTPTFDGDGLFEVECRGRRYAVNLAAKTCGCRNGMFLVSHVLMTSHQYGMVEATLRII